MNLTLELIAIIRECETADRSPKTKLDLVKSRLWNIVDRENQYNFNFEVRPQSTPREGES